MFAYTVHLVSLDNENDFLTETEGNRKKYVILTDVW